MKKILNVTHPTGEYPIVIGQGVYGDYELEGRYVVVSDENVAPLYSQRFPTAEEVIVVKAGEEQKHLGTVRGIYERLVGLGLGRDATLVALGGGVVGDMTGFAAATYMRGIKFVQCPTTLLAMVDASVGGKTGVDLPEGKNLVGAFWQPEAVLIDVDVLDTLPEDEFASGMAEVVKHGLIGDAGLFEETETGSLRSADRRQDLVARAVEVKRKVVERDPFETEGVRALLNLGHTFGHAIEHVSGYNVKHGFGVAMGMVVAGVVSANLGHCSGDLVARIEATLQANGLPTRIPQLDVDEILHVMQSDKKKKGKQVRFILLRDVGDCFMTAEVPETLIRETMESLMI